jgi:hypothetical protein
MVELDKRRSLMKSHFCVFALSAMVAMSGPALAQSSEAGEQGQEASVETVEASLATGESALKVTAGVASLPIGIAGAVSTDAGLGSLELAAASGEFSTEPLSVSHTVVVAPRPQPVPGLDAADDEASATDE